MGWKEQLQKASFRGVPFLFEASDGELGRRVVLHEYPLRDKPFAEDLGRKARRWSIEAYVLGSGYMAQRDALVKAIEEAGPGALVHPYLGTLQVVLVEARGPRESSREGGMARFALTFAEAGDNTYPAAAIATGTAVADRADAALAVAAADFAGGFDLAGQPELVATAAEDLGQGLLSRLAALSRRMPALPAEATAYAASLQQGSGGLSGHPARADRRSGDAAGQPLQPAAGRLRSLPRSLRLRRRCRCRAAHHPEPHPAGRQPGRPHRPGAPDRRHRGRPHQQHGRLYQPQRGGDCARRAFRPPRA